jgi:hypothetical protein
MKKNTDDIKYYILNKLSNPEEISKRLGLKLSSVEGEERIIASSAVIPNVTYPGKKWTVIGIAFILDVLIDKVIAATLGGPAGTVWFIIQMASLFVDIVDPYGYNQTISRSELDDAINRYQAELVKALKSVEQKQLIINQALEEYKDNPTVDRKFVEDLYEVLTDYWSEAPGLNPNAKECYGDLEEFNRLSGPPKEGCNQIYKQSYENFVAENGELYIQQATPENNDRINEAFAVIYASIVKNNLKNYKDSVRNLSLLILIVIVFIVLLIFFIRYIIKKRK